MRLRGLPDAIFFALGGHRTGGPVRLMPIKGVELLRWLREGNEARALLHRPGPHRSPVGGMPIVAKGGVSYVGQQGDRRRTKFRWRSNNLTPGLPARIPNSQVPADAHPEEANPGSQSRRRAPKCSGTGEQLPGSYGEGPEEANPGSQSRERRSPLPANQRPRVLRAPGTPAIGDVPSRRRL